MKLNDLPLAEFDEFFNTNASKLTAKLKSIRSQVVRDLKAYFQCLAGFPEKPIDTDAQGIVQWSLTTNVVAVRVFL
jgi:hypothetical protein